MFKYDRDFGLESSGGLPRLLRPGCPEFGKASIFRYFAYHWQRFFKVDHGRIVDNEITDDSETQEAEDSAFAPHQPCVDKRWGWSGKRPPGAFPAGDFRCCYTKSETALCGHSNGIGVSFQVAEHSMHRLLRSWYVFHVGNVRDDPAGLRHGQGHLDWMIFLVSCRYVSDTI